ncbi:uncharacterized protein TRIVIDRAFT_188014 [Trichoderma virens Gv29-8]|uniref:Uncharacterized protein n=1 Tax=Hypocrea virens (strain Gv29-8 / FGSC 10586) TaxID=413071 RepID=G9MFB7_HYPVG|nr:uncharacterized protein TRIVIDRAFT_188014 [Trichoderma virens Gv29-8]EHK27083.1 hypothetical protein TRIVIDRAFT_188014 [Trichoderma virens Gv29-8]UKZ57537.1 hypothetical protein TrVGV298_011396 [Trichoderma virens]
MSSKIIRVALVGLSANATTSWAAAAHLPYLQSARGQTQYKVVALLNSSKEAAERARSHFNLPSTVKAYGDPAQLAADDEVDLVSVVTRVDKHYSAAEPSIRAGKAVYVEWPLTESLKRSVALLGENKGRDTSIIGLQGRLSPVASKIKEVLASGRIGKVLDSQFKDFQSKLQIRWPEVEIVNNDGVKLRTRQSDIPDLITAHGELAPGVADIQDGATLSTFFRSGPTFKDELPYVWYIQGQRGDLKITSPIGPILQAATVPGVKIELHDCITDEVTEIPWESEWKDWQNELQWFQQEDREAVPVGGDWPRLEDAIRRHEELDKMLNDFDKTN